MSYEKTLHKNASSKYYTFYILENIVTLKMLATFVERSTPLPKELLHLYSQLARFPEVHRLTDTHHT